VDLVGVEVRARGQPAGPDATRGLLSREGRRDREQAEPVLAPAALHAVEIRHRAAEHLEPAAHAEHPAPLPVMRVDGVEETARPEGP
jgi:hypothetical protein